MLLILSLVDVWVILFGKFEKSLFELHQLRPLCDITQQLYLDMEPWSDWFHNELEKKKKKGKKIP